MEEQNYYKVSTFTIWLNSLKQTEYIGLQAHFSEFNNGILFNPSINNVTIVLLFSKYKEKTMTKLTSDCITDCFVLIYCTYNKIET